jgi:hypothetical protein
VGKLLNRRRQAPTLDYDAARTLLEQEFATVEALVLEGKELAPPEELRLPFDAIFESRTQAYREVFLGCMLARLQNRNIGIHKPYVNQGANAYNGRTLDERVVNPFLHDKRVPCSRGPFLSAFRRNVRFVQGTRKGLRDQAGYDSLLALINYVAEIDDQDELKSLLRCLLFRLIRLREQTEVPVSRLHRISLDQYGELIAGLLMVPSGGRFPVLLVEAAFRAIKEAFALDWQIEAQGINVADRAAGAGGDITIRRAEQIVLAAEVTERTVDRNRVVATFQTKIAPTGIDDYVFLVASNVSEEAVRQARQYFAQGHEINFLEITAWIRMVLATIGRRGRDTFNRTLLEKVASPDTPAAPRVAWNEQIARIAAG